MTVEDRINADMGNDAGGDAGNDAAVADRAVDTSNNDDGRDVGADKGADTSAAKGADAGDKSDADWFGPDWRDKFSLGLPEDHREKAKGYLKTRSSPYDVLRAGMSADAKINELMTGRVKIPTGKDDDPKDVAAYRKARGVPETPDKYAIDVPEEVGELSALDQELKDEFLKEAHKRNWGQADVDFAWKSWFANQKLLQAEKAKQVLTAQQAAIDDLRIEYGKEYRPNIELVNRMFQQEMSELGMSDAQERHNALSMRFEDGTALGEQPWFVKMMVKIAKERADDGALVMGETADGGDLDAREKQIMSLMHTDPKEYARMQPELKDIIAAQNRRKARGG